MRIDGNRITRCGDCKSCANLPGGEKWICRHPELDGEREIDHADAPPPEWCPLPNDDCKQTVVDVYRILFKGCSQLTEDEAFELLNDAGMLPEVIPEMPGRGRQ